MKDFGGTLIRTEKLRRGTMNGIAGTVFIVDDVQDIRTALSRLLTTADYRVRLFESAEKFLEGQDAAEPGCLLLDIGLPGLSGIELQRSLFDSPHARPIVFLTGIGDVQASVNAMKAGAVDFLTKPIDSQRLFAAIEEALRRDAAQRVDRAIRDTIELRFKQLTRREREVMTRIVRGRLNKQIAWEFGCGEKTVKVHRARVMHKMGVRSIPALVRLAECVGIAMELMACTDARALGVRPIRTAHGQSDANRVGRQSLFPLRHSGERLDSPAAQDPIATPDNGALCRSSYAAAVHWQFVQIPR
jgi:FixJ family two-component response regulator